MSLFALPFPPISPIAFELGPLSIRWYGLAYMAGLLLGWFYIRRLLTTERLWDGKPAFSETLVDDLLLWTTLGVVIGGRLGHILLYAPDYFLANPLEIFSLWKGGMSFHGGLIGTGLAIYIFAKRNGINVYSVMDVVAAAVPFGLFFGRVANFINQEIVGKATDVPWAVIFPKVDSLARHPVQLYEAILEGLVLFIILRHFTHKRLSLTLPGMTTGIFLVGYGLSRIVAEVFKDTNDDHFLTVGIFKPGMAYSIPMVLLGIYFYRRAIQSENNRGTRHTVQ